MTPTNSETQTITFVYDTEGNAVGRLAEVISEEKVNNLNDIFFASKGKDNKRIGWGILFGLNINEQLREDIINHYMATCDAVYHLEDMYFSYIEAKSVWENQ